MTRTKRSGPHWKSSDVAWRGPRRPYDLGKEVGVQVLLVVLLAAVLSLVFASPDPPSATMKEWATQAPLDFTTTTVSEIARTSASATYGPPYQPASQQNGSLQTLGPIAPQQWVGEQIPIDTFTDYVSDPLTRLGSPAVQAALKVWSSAPAALQTRWANAYTSALAKASFDGDSITAASGLFGPLPVIVTAQYRYALSGGLDAALLASDKTSTNGSPVWYSDDQTRALLYFGDSGQGGGATGCISPGQRVTRPDTCWWYNQSVSNTSPRHAGYLDGGTWGVVNEVGNWPGAWWLFPYSFWYQWGYGASGAAADLYAMIMTGCLTLLVAFVPWIPGLRGIPKATRLYRLMWSDYYRLVEQRRPSGQAVEQPSAGVQS